MNLKVPGAILPLGCAILSTRVKTVRGVGTTPLGELGLIFNKCLIMHENECNLAGDTISLNDDIFQIIHCIRFIPGLLR